MCVRVCVKLVRGSKYTSERVYGLLLCRRWVTPTLLYNGNCVIARNRLLVSPHTFTFFPSFFTISVILGSLFFFFSCHKCTHTQTHKCSVSLYGLYNRGLLRVVVSDGCVSYTADSFLHSFSVSKRPIHVKED